MRKNHQGFTLTEIVLAILIISVTILSIVSVFTYGANYSLKIKNQAEGEKILTLMEEEIQKHPYILPKIGSPYQKPPIPIPIPFGNDSGVESKFEKVPKTSFPNFNLEEIYDYKVKVTKPPTGMDSATLLQEVELTVKGPLEENENDKYKGGTKLTKEYDMKFYIPILKE